MMNPYPAPCQSPDMNMVVISGTISSETKAPTDGLRPPNPGRPFAARRLVSHSTIGL